jgi:predicted metal-binding protein
MVNTASYEIVEGIAKECGYTHWGVLEPATMVFRPEVRDMCKANRCGRYGKNWGCPPGLGTLDECKARVAGYTSGILLQTTAMMEDEFDADAITGASKINGERTLQFAKMLREKFPHCIIFGGGACKNCKTCTYPDAPCRFPDKLMPSIEAFGMVVSDLCKANNLPYYYGKLTLTYTSAAIF